ncbi:MULTISPECIES: hypothetical protein [Paenibacillus]|uniref:DUF2642 domain-containing protein n=1 Tax=Paenibacillus campinasensis TaxID=66347 RepID=A0A268F2K6_9BACL|nr:MULTISPECIES: hypothetical protein [Paenibacillus]MUG65972.1 hypothetical protein [Paenibacillus campinasensis]PAD79564.1 hypothetical protein CHH67_03555 [Paenibacillus campinasensis]PAK51761.1 hypothetical protein CHH75_14445 [Paenibacillus sp. 7541]
MSTYPGQQLLFQCDHQLVNSMKKHKEHAYQSLQKALHHKVRVHTMDDEIVEGVIINVDAKNVYIHIEHDPRGLYPYGPRPRPPYPPYGGYPPYPANPYYSNVILPLALFNLLAVSLL